MTDNQMTDFYLPWSVRRIVIQYLSRYPSERRRLAKLRRHLRLGRGNNIISRHARPGHITVSGIVLSSDLRRVLMIHHKKLGKFIQPGGHVEKTDRDFMLAAKREVIEETMVGNLIPLLATVGDNIPFDIDIHDIPASSDKTETRHLHFDFR